MTNFTIETLHTIEDYENAVRHELDLAIAYTKDAITKSQKAQAAYYRMYLNCVELQKVNAHGEKNMTWETYFCYLTGYKSPSRFYQLKKVMAYAQVITEELGIIPTEWELREFPTDTISPDNRNEVIETFRIGKQSAKLRGDSATPKSVDFKTAQEVIAEIQSTLVSSIKDENGIPVSDTDEIIETLLQKAHDERQKRQWEHIANNSKWDISERHTAVGVGLRKQSRKRLRTRLRVPIRNTGQIQILVKVRKDES